MFDKVDHTRYYEVSDKRGTIRLQTLALAHAQVFVRERYEKEGNILEIVECTRS